jgi:DNA-binding MarR family transcriptional regulator
MGDKSTLIDARRKNWFWDYNDIFGSELTPNAKLVRLYLAKCADNNTRQAWPSLSNIAENCGISRTTAKKVINELVEAGWLIKKTRKEDGVYTSNLYYLPDPDEIAKNKSKANDQKRGRADNDLPCNEMAGVGQNPTHGRVNTDPGVGRETTRNNTHIVTIPNEQDYIKDRVTNDSLRSSLVTRGQQKSEQETDIQNFNIETSEITLESDLTSPGVFNKKIPVENVTVFKQETISSEPGINNKRAHVEREPELNQEALFTETGVNNNKPPVEKEPDLYQKTLPQEETLNNIPAEKESILNQEQIFTETGVNNKKSTVEKELNLTQDTLSTRTDGINNQMPVESESILEQGEISTETGVNNKKSTAERELNINQDTLSIGTGGINNMPVEKEPDLNQETSTVEVTPQITNADLITALGDSLREAWDGPPAKAYAIAGRMYYLYDYPAAEASINNFCRQVKNGFKPKNPIAYLMKVAREKKKEFESEYEVSQPEEELEYFSIQYPEEHKKRVAEAKRVSAEHERYLKDYRDFLINKAPPIPGFITPGGCYKQLQEGGMKCN